MKWENEKKTQKNFTDNETHILLTYVRFHEKITTLRSTLENLL